MMEENPGSGVQVPGWLLAVAAAGGLWWFLKNKKGGNGLPAPQGTPGAPQAAAIPGMPAPQGGPQTGPGPEQASQQSYAGQVQGGGVITDPYAPAGLSGQPSGGQGQPQVPPGNANPANWKYNPGVQAGHAGMYEDLGGLGLL